MSTERNTVLAEWMKPQRSSVEHPKTKTAAVLLLELRQREDRASAGDPDGVLAGLDGEVPLCPRRLDGEGGVHFLTLRFPDSGGEPDRVRSLFGGLRRHFQFVLIHAPAEG